uniref:LP03131p n=1 Tax=Drosophila melanogaster TaxID=7227 RepID=Q8MS94_DROME|nr:LP03131p [Drosophila melanogaster]
MAPYTPVATSKTGRMPPAFVQSALQPSRPSVKANATLWLVQWWPSRIMASPRLVASAGSSSRSSSTARTSPCTPPSRPIFH